MQKDAARCSKNLAAFLVTAALKAGPASSAQPSCCRWLRRRRRGSLMIPGLFLYHWSRSWLIILRRSFWLAPRAGSCNKVLRTPPKTQLATPRAVNHVHEVQDAQPPGGHGVGQERVQRLPAPCQVGRLAQRCGQSPGSPAPQVSVGVVSPISQTFTTDLLGVVVRQPPFLAVALLIPLGDEQDKGPLGAIWLQGHRLAIHRAGPQGPEVSQEGLSGAVGLCSFFALDAGAGHVLCDLLVPITEQG